MGLLNNKVMECLKKRSNNGMVKKRDAEDAFRFFRLRNDDLMPAMRELENEGLVRVLHVKKRVNIQIIKNTDNDS